jgi:hypothetical protein
LVVWIFQRIWPLHLAYWIFCQYIVHNIFLLFFNYKIGSKAPSLIPDIGGLSSLSLVLFSWSVCLKLYQLCWSAQRTSVWFHWFSYWFFFFPQWHQNLFHIDIQQLKWNKWLSVQ